MQIEIKIDEAYKEPRILITASAMTEEVGRLVQRLSEQTPQMLTGFSDDTAVPLDSSDIYNIYASGGKVCAVTGSGEYNLRLRLYEAESRLDKTQFVRISNSEIINLKKVKSFDLSIMGTVCVRLSNGAVSYVSRRFVPKIKQLLGL